MVRRDDRCHDKLTPPSGSRSASTFRTWVFCSVYSSRTAAFSARRRADLSRDRARRRPASARRWRWRTRSLHPRRGGPRPLCGCDGWFADGSGRSSRCGGCWLNARGLRVPQTGIVDALRKLTPIPVPPDPPKHSRRVTRLRFCPISSAQLREQLEHSRSGDAVDDLL